MTKKLTLLLTLAALLLCPLCHAEELNREYITVAENAVLPDEAVLAAQYPSTLTRGERDLDLDHLLITLLGEGYTLEERSEYDHEDEYRSAGGEEPWEWRTVRLYDEDELMDEAFSYSNPWVCGERGGEYEAPSMNMLPDESIVLCRALLDGIVPEEWLAAPDMMRHIRARWDYSDRWMTESEYKSYCFERKYHSFLFSQTSESGLPIHGQDVYATVGVDGLSGLSINRHHFTESEDLISPMPLADALTLANSTREAHCTLLAADLRYSNWLTEDDTYHLSWYLVTDAGSYIVDCVEGKHRCDSYEY